MFIVSILYNISAESTISTGYSRPHIRKFHCVYSRIFYRNFITFIMVFTLPTFKSVYLVRNPLYLFSELSVILLRILLFESLFEGASFGRILLCLFCVTFLRILLFRLDTQERVISENSTVFIFVHSTKTFYYILESIFYSSDWAFKIT